MNMSLIDWGIVLGLLVILIWGAASTRRHAGSVAGFLAAERCGGRYLIAVADNMAQLGVISLVWYFEQNYQVGYTSIWWPLMEGPAMIIMALSGWVIYRFRQTRALTLAQFFEMRYSRKFRVFAGLVAYLAGIINFAIFPSVGARFFIALCGLPTAFTVVGFDVATYPLMMVLLLLVSLALLFLGGQIAVMVTDFLQGIVCNFAFIIVVVFLLCTFKWEQIAEVLLAAPAGQSMVDPFDLGQEKHFDFWYYVIGVIIMFYGCKSWQGTQGYNCSAKNAHEAKMAGILSPWRFRVLMLIVLVLPICVRTFLQHPDFAAQAAVVSQSLEALAAPSPGVKEALQNQLRTPLAMSVMLPAGLLGLACAAMLGAFISTHDTYLHSWGTILVQDVILPFRVKPLTPRQHIRMLRLSILAVAVFIFLVSLLFQHTQFIAMFCALTASVFVGGAGSVIIGGLYWDRGTTAAAWAAMATGMCAALAGIVIKQIQPAFFLTGQEMSFLAIVASVAVYVLVSLLGPRTAFNMDRLLHRGQYAIAGEATATWKDARTWWEKLGFSKDFTGGDRIVAYITLAWPLVWTVIFVVVTVYSLTVDVSATSWLAFWHGWTWFILACAILVTTWFTIGGYFDLRYLFRQLRTRAANPLDDGRVEHNE
ncbi:MAG: sodium:solute symporter [Planctomycetes bacterium]|nr:sodium:solute symporter [Planctomycetota bacterium]